MSRFLLNENRKWVCVLSGCLALTSGHVHAQAAGASGPIEEVVVTGSRLSRSGFDTPTPLTALGYEDIETQAPENIAELVNNLPSVLGSTTGTTNSGSLASGIAGISAVNLRGLGAGRTLLLLDGRRSPISSSNGLVDTNTMPQGLINRVEVTTGGASAAYGSGAMGGVVNFMLDKNYQGIKGFADYGATSSNENKSRRFGLTAGTDFASGRGHVLFDAQATDIDGIHNKQASWDRSGFHVMPNPDRATPGAPAFIVDNQIGLSSQTLGGLIVAGPLRGTYFGEGGSVNQLNFGEVGGAWMRGGDWELTNHQKGTQSLAAAEERQSVFARMSFDVSDSVSVFGEASYAAFEGFANYIRVPTLRRTVRRDYAFLPPEIGGAMDEAGIDSFQLSTANGDAGLAGHSNERKTTRFVLGAEGIFPMLGHDWEWDASFAKMETVADQQYLPNIYHLQKIGLAMDAVIDPASGNPVCRSTLTDPGNGCLPLNILGVGVSDPAAWDYVTGGPERRETFGLDVAAINFRVNDIDGWAGPISLAFGAEWQEHSIAGEVEEQFRSGWRFGNFQEDNGKYTVKEAYAEVLIPLGSGVEFNGAYRYADYSLSGSVGAYKLGLTWAPIEDVLLRGTLSRDIRAGNMAELFSTGTARGNTIDIGGVIVPYQQNLVGNTRIEPEVADSWSVGVVVQPRFLPGVGASIDYYDIEVDKVIGFIGPEQVANFCFESNIQIYCDALVFSDPNDVTTLTNINVFWENLNRLRSRGLDIELSYDFEMADFFSSVPGDVSLRFMATHYMESTTDNRTTAINEAGSSGGAAGGGTPDWLYRATARYSNGPWTLNMTMRGVSSGVLSTAYIECKTNCPESRFPALTINDNSVSGQVVFDAYVGRTFKWRESSGQVFLSALNIFDKNPPLLSSPTLQGTDVNPAYPATNRSLYDFLGRRFRAGIRVEF